jgi:hypothetical protein
MADVPVTSPAPKASPYDEARAIICDQLWPQAFFAKMSSLGIDPRTPEEAQQILLMANRVRALDGIQSTKAATDRTSWLAAVNQQLEADLQAAGVLDAPQLKLAAEELAQNPVLRDAALLLHDALSQTAA